jgi:hypothetical protein
MTTVHERAPATGEPASAGRVLRRRWRYVRGLLAAVLAVVVVAIVLAALEPREHPQDLDPESPSPGGARALVQILDRQGTPVTVSRAVEDAADVMRSNPDAVLVVVRSERLTGADLVTLASLPGDMVLVEPTQQALRELAPGVMRADVTVDEVVEPRCGLRAATLAGNAGFGDGTTYEAPRGATACYPADSKPHVVRLGAGGRTVTVVGSREPFTNDALDENGNAALAMNLTGERATAVWLMPPLRPAGATADDKEYTDLVPRGVKLAILQLVVAAALVALWRARRLGPVVAEPLPVVVRSAEAVEGRARLYRSRRARDRAADALRSGARERLLPLLGLPGSVAQDMSMAAQVVAAVAERTDQDATTIGLALYGPAPVNDAELVGLADFLDDLEGQVRRW